VVRLTRGFRWEDAPGCYSTAPHQRSLGAAAETPSPLRLELCPGDLREAVPKGTIFLPGNDFHFHFHLSAGHAAGRSRDQSVINRHLRAPVC